MAEDVCDSWEEIIENETLCSKLDSIKFDREDGSSKDFQGSNLTNCNGNGIKILKRPNDVKPLNSNVASYSKIVNPDSFPDFTYNSSSMLVSSSPSQNSSAQYAARVKGKTQDVAKCVNSESSLSSNHKIGLAPQITLEDNTRTQYVPQVKILKRPKGSPVGSKGGQNGDSKVSPSKSQASGILPLGKSLQEREAEYAKVRLRIMGSAVPDYKDCNLTGSHSQLPTSASASSCSAKANGDSVSNFRKTNDVPVIRTPQAPDGSKGFSRR